MTHRLTRIQVIRSNTTFSKLRFSYFGKICFTAQKMNLFFLKWIDSFFKLMPCSLKVFANFVLCIKYLGSAFYAFKTTEFHLLKKSPFIFLKIILFIITSICSFYNSFSNCFLNFCYKPFLIKRELYLYTKGVEKMCFHKD